MASNEEEKTSKKRSSEDPEKQAAREAAEAELAQNQQYLEDEAKDKGPLGNPVSLRAEVDEEEAPPESKEDHKIPLIYEGTWVILAGTDNIPEECWGHEAVVTNAPMKNSDGDEQVPFEHQYQEDDTVFTVRTRDEYSATLSATRDDFAEVSTSGGRTGLGHAG